jgi:hypothetical protein
MRAVHGRRHNRRNPGRNRCRPSFLGAIVNGIRDRDSARPDARPFEKDPSDGQ